MQRRTSRPGVREVAKSTTIAYPPGRSGGMAAPELQSLAAPRPSWSFMTTAEDDDRHLLGLLRQRDGAAFRILVERHLPLVTGVARRILRDDAEADDVAQEAMLRLWQGGGGLEVGPGGIRPWLRRVTSNLCIDRIRSRSRTDVTDEVPDQPVAANQLSNLVEDDMAARVQQALLALPERQRQALVLFHYEGLSQIEVAGVLCVTDEAVESLLSRARRALRGSLKDEWRQLLPGAAGDA